MLGLAVLPGSAICQQKSLKDQLVGTWEIVSWERTNPDGTKAQAFGANPKGINVFGADGRFVVFFTRADLPKLASNDRLKSTPQEAKAIVDGSIAYHGTYSVDEATKTIVLNIENTTFPKSARASTEASYQLAHGGRAEIQQSHRHCWRPNPSNIEAGQVGHVNR